MSRPSWKIQAHWRVGEEQRSYSAFYVRTRRQARKAARDVTKTLSHFVDLVITVEPVDRAIADAAEAEREVALANRPRPLLHLYNASHDGALCGASVDELNALATAEMQELSTNVRCDRCGELASSGTQHHP